ncbi:hypothetical protein CB1_000238018 [Camelus ferus]|nr:hypothetical protein CB1_000238018 [Camelus ferus]
MFAYVNLALELNLCDENLTKATTAPDPLLQHPDTFHDPRKHGAYLAAASLIVVPACSQSSPCDATPGVLASSVVHVNAVPLDITAKLENQGMPSGDTEHIMAVVDLSFAFFRVPQDPTSGKLGLPGNLCHSLLRGCMYNFMHRKLVEDGSFSCVIQPNNYNFVLLVIEQFPYPGEENSHSRAAEPPPATQATVLP